MATGVSQSTPARATLARITAGSTPARPRRGDATRRRPQLQRQSGERFHAYEAETPTGPRSFDLTTTAVWDTSGYASAGRGAGCYVGDFRV